MPCRTQRLLAANATALWLASVVLMLSPTALEGDVRTVMIVASVNVGALAACLTTVAVMPYLLKDFYRETVMDHVGAFLAGVAVGQQDEPVEPTRLHAVR